MVQRKLRGLLWEKARLPQHEKNEVIGHFGVRLVNSLFPGGEILHKKDPRGDILHPELGLLEVKMSSSRGQPKIGEDQLLRHYDLAEGGFLYAFVRYGNPSQKTSKFSKGNNNTRVTLLNKIAKSPSEVTRFLVERVTAVFLVDISIVCAVWSCDPVRSVQLVSRGRERVCINVPVRDLRQFASGSPDFFQRFGLNHADYVVTSEEVETRVGEHLTVVTVHKIAKIQTKEDFNLSLDFGTSVVPNT